VRRLAAEGIAACAVVPLRPGGEQVGSLTFATAAGSPRVPEALPVPSGIGGLPAIDLPPDAPVAWADGHELQQVAVNLITTAYHVPREVAGSRRLTISSAYDARHPGGPRGRSLIPAPGFPSRSSAGSSSRSSRRSPGGREGDSACRSAGASSPAGPRRP